jgi:3-dehydroquinate synthetase
MKNSEEAAAMTGSSLSSSVLAAWTSLAPEIRAALVASEGGSPNTSTTREGSSASSMTSGSSDDGGDKSEPEGVYIEECTESGTKVVLRPLERAPKNVFEFEKTTAKESTKIEKTGSSTITTKTTVVTSTKGWRNIFTLPISYDVNVVPNGTLLDAKNPQLLDATGVHPEGYNRRFAVIDQEVNKIYGKRIHEYFTQNKIELVSCVLPGGETDKRPEAVDKVLDELCAYKLRRREPFLAIGGGVVLDIAGMAACLYRRGVPFVRVPTTLLAIVDASVGVKNGVDYCCTPINETFKNRIGSFYAPSSCLLDNSFIATQDVRNVSNGFGEILKLALVRSVDMFELLETHGAALVQSRFSKDASTVPDGVGERVIDLSIQIMLEELGPNLWEYNLERCVDYGECAATFSGFLSFWKYFLCKNSRIRLLYSIYRPYIFETARDGPGGGHYAWRSCQY